MARTPNDLRQHEQRQQQGFLAATRRFAARRVPTPGRRTLPVKLAAGLLGLDGLFVVLVGLFDSGGSLLDRLVFLVFMAGPLLAGAAALLWGRLRGYWIGFGVAAVLTLAALAFLAVNLNVSGGIVLVFAILPLALLLVRGDRVEAWRKVWGWFTLMAVVGGACTVGGAVAVVGGELGMLGVPLFGLALLVILPALHPRGTGERHGNVLLPAAGILMGLASLSIALFGTSDRYPRGFLVVIGILGAVFFLGGTVFVLVRDRRRR